MTGYVVGKFRFEVFEPWVRLISKGYVTSQDGDDVTIAMDRDDLLDLKYAVEKAIRLFDEEHRKKHPKKGEAA